VKIIARSRGRWSYRRRSAFGGARRAFSMPGSVAPGHCGIITRFRNSCWVGFPKTDSRSWRSGDWNRNARLDQELAETPTSRWCKRCWDEKLARRSWELQRSAHDEHRLKEDFASDEAMKRKYAARMAAAMKYTASGEDLSRRGGGKGATPLKSNGSHYRFWRGGGWGLAAVSPSAGSDSLCGHPRRSWVKASKSRPSPSRIAVLPVKACHRWTTRST
jgi:hypothetical protein